ncbi:hypothetical protein K450DRAFT_200552 [Umbelopsis ramanniana AG]|uniref:Uncharacterized protein n=1 Tax=Umbelopsis ramanniana AG TaxID=1314678 RepID=A0AAD5E7C6_UMBRA|nr:uncharacterized protein K450DRAFT_200552 [Umbelopsis ramanniana AG]KAI8578169.1 hypothetical protein K450DRAFT_200552 [Umbelopsis ramanniana AG]
METNTKSNGDWDIQVSYSVPGSSLNYTQTLQNTITDAVYRVGRTITCYYATNDNAYIMANVVSVSGGTIFALIILCILCIPLVFGVMYLLRIVLVYISDHLKAMAKSISQNLANCATKLRSLFKTEGFESQSECDTSSPEKLMSNRDVGYALMPIANFKASLGHTKLWLKARCTFSRPNTNLHKDMCQESFITQDTFGCSPTSTEELPLYSKDGCNVPP